MPSLAGHPRSRQLTAIFLDALQAQGHPLGVGAHQSVQELLQRLPAQTDDITLRDALIALIATNATEQRRYRELFAEAQRIAAATEATEEEASPSTVARQRNRELWRTLRLAAALLGLLLLPFLAYLFWPDQEFILPERTVGVYTNTRTPLPNLDSLSEIGRVGTYAWPAPGAANAPRVGRLDTVAGRLLYEAPGDTLNDTFVLTLRGSKKRVATVRYRIIVRPDTARTPVPVEVGIAKQDTTADFSPIDPLPHPRSLADLAPVKPTTSSYFDLLHHFWWPLLFLGYVIVLGLVFLFFYYHRKRNTHLVAELEETDGAPHFWRIELPELRAGIDWGTDYPALLRQLRRRREDDFRELDLDQTIDHTIRRGGFPSFRYRSATRPAEYLLLIDRGAAANHHARLFEQLYQQLLAEEVLIARYFYDGDPRLLYQDDRAQATPLLQLQRRFPQARLLLVGSGDRLLNPASGRLARWVDKQFGPWTNRSILTTTPSSNWSMAEKRLSSFFVLLPASMTGLRRLVEHINDGQSDESAISNKRMVADAHQEPLQLSGSLIGSLQRSYPQPEQLLWIAACALYPSLHWDLTLFFGQTVGETTGTNLLTSKNLLALSRLPWFAQGHIPPRARAELTDWLRATHPKLHRSFRRALQSALTQATPPPENSVARRDLDFFQLNNEFHLTTPGTPERKAVLDKIGHHLANGHAADVTVARFLEEPDDNAIVLPKSWHKRLYPEGLPGLGLKPEWQRLRQLALPLLLLFGLVGIWQRPPLTPGCSTPVWTINDTLNFARDTLVQIQLCDKLDSLILEEHYWRQRINRAQRIAALDSTFTFAALPGLDAERRVTERPARLAPTLQAFLARTPQDSLEQTHRERVGAMLWNRGLQRLDTTLSVDTRACDFLAQAGELIDLPDRRRKLIAAYCVPDLLNLDVKVLIERAIQNLQAVDRQLANFSNERNEAEAKALRQRIGDWIEAEQAKLVDGTFSREDLSYYRVLLERWEQLQGIEEAGASSEAGETTPIASDTASDEAAETTPGSNETTEPQVFNPVNETSFSEELLPTVPDLQVYQDTFLKQVPLFRDWLDESGVGIILNYRELDIKADVLNVYLEFSSEELGVQIATWDILNKYFAQKEPLSLEEALLRETAKAFRLPEKNVTVQVYNTYDLSETPLFSRVLYWENGTVSVEQSNPKGNTNLASDKQSLDSLLVALEAKFPGISSGIVTPPPRPLMTQIPAATFQMGDTSGDGGNGEQPVHEVSLSPYALGRYEVTFEEYDLFCEATNREKPEDEGWGRGRHPVINVSWDDAVTYCNWLSGQHGYDSVYTISGDNVSADWSANGYRLPTEAEWEYAASYRPNGTKARFGNGRDTIDPAGINFFALAELQEDYSVVGTYRARTIPAGSLGSPNAWQLHDLSGNVFEWCWDWYGDYAGVSQENPRGAESGTYRVLRGGSWSHDPSYCRAANRTLSGPTIRGYNVGFRLARSL